MVTQAQWVGGESHHRELSSWRDHPSYIYEYEVRTALVKNTDLRGYCSMSAQRLQCCMPRPDAFCGSHMVLRLL